jgi:hypothetical protein
VVRLVPVVKTATAAKGVGSGRAILDWLSDHPVPAYARRSAEEIDAAIGDEREAWD